MLRSTVDDKLDVRPPIAGFELIGHPKGESSDFDSGLPIFVPDPSTAGSTPLMHFETLSSP